ncbi:MAG TPA: response regulator [Tepidisphaeraceae bacterium]|jgi:putative two-component system response regulator|nr:response regulator [Tepidisphaeraceae bacterium]
MRALIVDDDEFSLELLDDVLKQLGHEVERAADGAAALEKLRSGEIHLVITDWEMPSMNGLELCRAVRSGDYEGYVFIIMLTSRDGGQQRIEGLHAGADAFLTKPLNPDELLVSLKTAERILSLETRDLAMFALAKLSESRDSDTGAHIERVQSYARVLAQHLSTTETYSDQIDGEFVRLIYQTSPLHDIGKVGIPDAVLLKPGTLNEQEMSIMRTHVTLGAHTLEASLQRFPGVRFLQMARDIAVAHHERWDGKGYPANLAGTEIPLAARIVALADVYDALTSKRVYRDAMSHAQAKTMILRERGAHFDPAIVDAFSQTEARFVAIKEQFRDEETAAKTDGPAPAPRAKIEVPHQVLVVDDDEAARLMLTTFINSIGFECISCGTAHDALAALDLYHPRLIISDWEMPEIDGLELCRRVRTRTQAAHVQFIMLTVHASNDDLKRAFDAGVDDFIAKPFSEADLTARLRAGMRAIAMHDELSRQNQSTQELNEQLRNLNNRLQKLAITDDLTGLYNRRQAMHRLEEHWSMCERYQRPLAVVLVDIDLFKQVNDKHGHSAGDAILRSVSEILRNCVRSTDIVCRVGGEEFLIILPCQTLQDAEVCANRCRAEVEAREFDCGGQIVRTTISAGISARAAGMQQYTEIVKGADIALYLAKNAGRNAVRSAAGALPQTAAPTAA